MTRIEKNIFTNFLLMKYLFKFYKIFISPLFPPSCRFHPTCSEYASESIEKHGIIKGGILAIYRILRCNPWGGSGYNPVPEKTSKNDK
ncbi:MAG: membrane protein insertion efficiency factor YidD [Rickettsiales bacterium]|nr:membrane protein insertion efficiency factor YidD [Rickettsiales bacterium]